MDLLCQAIRTRAVVAFSYKGKRRVVEPHMLSLYRNGEEILHAWQRSGGSGVEWRDFHASEIGACELTGDRFQRPHDGYNPDAKPYAVVICRIEPMETKRAPRGALSSR